MSEIRIIKDSIFLVDLKEIAKQSFGDMVKAVVDLEKNIIVVGGELHADEEAVLIEQGSKQDSLWGFNIYIDQPRNSWLEFDSMVNIKPGQDNNSRKINDIGIQNQIKDMVNQLVK